MQESVRQLFPRARLSFWETVIAEADCVREIRLRVDCPIVVRHQKGEFYLDGSGRFCQNKESAYRAGSEEIEKLLVHLCHDSPYAFEDELRQGFITACGGHRIGVAGQAVLNQDGSIRTLKHIYYMNIRIAHQMFGIAEKILPYVYQDGQLSNVLIISPPGCGKTTLLRELVRRISDGNTYGAGMCVGVVDERSEIAGSYLGRPYNDLGCRTDVLDACPKVAGMMLLLRSMSPGVIAVDELGGTEDVEAVRMACACGSRVLATVHGVDPSDVKSKFPELLNHRIFNCLIVLGKRNGLPGVEKIYRGEECFFEC